MTSDILVEPRRAAKNGGLRPGTGDPELSPRELAEVKAALFYGNARATMGLIEFMLRRAEEAHELAEARVWERHRKRMDSTFQKVHEALELRRLCAPWNDLLTEANSATADRPSPHGDAAGATFDEMAEAAGRTMRNAAVKKGVQLL